MLVYLTKPFPAQSLIEPLEKMAGVHSSVRFVAARAA